MTSRSPTAGAACWPCRATGRRASSSTRRRGLGWAGGYVGHGVTATNLAGRTLADLVLDQRTALTELPWVGHRSRNWEPEPLRWIGVRGMYLAYKAADWHEARGRIDDVTDRGRRRQDRRPPALAGGFGLLLEPLQRQRDVLGIDRQGPTARKRGPNSVIGD